MSTRKLLLHSIGLVLILSLLAGCGSAPAQPTQLPTPSTAPADFTGHWEGLAAAFSLDLAQSGGKLLGGHVVVAQQGNKIDSLDKSIDGSVQGNKAIVQFQSSFTTKTGTAEITFIDEKTIFWKVTSAPDGENYFPPEATLAKKAPAAPASGQTGTITGGVHLQGSPTPAMVVYAVDPVSGLWTSVTTKATDGVAAFSLSVQPGTYQVFAAVEGGTTTSVGYSNDSLTLATVTVAAGQTVSDINVRPPSQSECGSMMGYPASPDGRFAAVAGPTAECLTSIPNAGSGQPGTITGRVHLQGPPTPQMVVYALDSATGQWAYVETNPADGEAPFSLTVVPGSYQIFAAVAGGTSVSLGYTADGLTLAKVTVAASQTVSGIEVGPPSQSQCGAMMGYPAAPDGRFAATAGPTAECLASIQKDASRIQFQPGATSWHTPGDLAPNASIRLVLSALKGQILTVELTTDPDPGPGPFASISIRGADGQLYTRDLTTKWKGALLASQDYYIEVRSLSQQNITYQLLVAIPAIGSTPYVPVTLDVCQMLQEMAAQAVPATYTLEASVPFTDPITGETGQSCNLTAKGTGKDFSNPGQVMAKLVSGFLGFTENPAYGAGGPTGMATAVTRDMAVVLISVHWVPAPGVQCPSDQPISACNLSPEQKQYTIKIQAAMK